SHLDEAGGESLHDTVLPPEVATDRICRGKWSADLVTKAAGKLAAPWPEEFVYTPEPLASTAGIVARPELYIDRGGLRVARLANAVSGYVTYAVGALDKRFYVYDRGVWRPEDCQIGAVVSALLGDAYRHSHLTNVEDTLRFRPDVRKIDCGPTPRWVNVANGLLDWRTRDLVGHTPDVLSTVQLPVAWEPDAACPEFEKFIREVLPADCVDPCEGGPGFIRELIGYCVYSGNPHQIAVLLRGKGRNGKGALLRVLQRLLGACNVSAVSLHDLSENRFRLADLYGKIANIAGDLDPKWLENTAKLKGITGDDLMPAEHKFGRTFSFTPWALPMYSANRGFASADSSDAYFGRWVVVPFPNSFLGREDRGLDARLAGELEGVLRLGVEALPALMRRGRLPEPASVRAAKHEFTIGGDQVRAWLDEGCEMDPAAWTKRTDLLEAYLMWDGLDGRSTLSKREFYARLEQVGALRPAKRDGYDGFRGVRLQVDK
ncbi:MAG TPA: phage/plasmid primase, P4 family, partial [Sporichthyaceae bacterium]